MNLTLIKPSVDLARLYLDMCQDFISYGEPWYPYRTLDEVLARFRREQEWMDGDVPDGYVPSIAMWFLKDEQVLAGTSRLRPHLNERFLKIGGHIGYDVRPTCRQQGIGTEILRLTLLEAGKAGLSKVLVTCEESNVGSWKVVEKNGGVLENRITDDRTGTIIRRYWIAL